VEPKNPVVAGARYVALGFEFAGVVVGAVLLGYYLDDYLGTAPWLMLLLIAAGLTGAVRRLLWSLKKHR